MVDIPRLPMKQLFLIRVTDDGMVTLEIVL